MCIPELIRLWLLKRATQIMASRMPDFIINPSGEREQTYRWHWLPKNNWLNIYIHRWVASDDDRAPHDHPYHNGSILLEGEYFEIVRQGNKDVRHWRQQGHFYVRRATTGHRVELISRYVHTMQGIKPVQRPCLTLFVTGRRFRDWGFLCPQGWVHEDDFRDTRDKGKIGKGCNG